MTLARVSADICIFLAVCSRGSAIHVQKEPSVPELAQKFCSQGYFNKNEFGSAFNTRREPCPPGTLNYKPVHKLVHRASSVRRERLASVLEIQVVS